MQIGMIGLGRMGCNMTLRLMVAGHECVVYDQRPKTVDELREQGAAGSTSIEDLVAELRNPRTIWLMIPTTAVDGLLAQLIPLLEIGDVVIDGGNSNYRDDIRRAEALEKRGVHYVDVGTSGGVAGLKRGYCLMIGGETEVVQRLDPLFSALAPGTESAARTPGRRGPNAPAERGYLHCGPAGAGHFVKMVHNGIEYGLMAAYAEGLNILRHADAGNRSRDGDAETSPIRNPEYYRYELPLSEIVEVWRRGSVVSSWLLDLIAAALSDDEELATFAGHVSDSGEGRWTVLAATEEGVPAPVISAALYERFASRGNGDYASRLLSAMRKQFGGHDEKINSS